MFPSLHEELMSELVNTRVPCTCLQLLKGHLIQSKMKIKQLNYGLINTQMSENFLGRQVCNLMIVQLFFIEILQLPFFSLPLS